MRRFTLAGRAVALHNPGTGAWTDLLYANGQMVGEVEGTEAATPAVRLLDHLGSLAVLTDSSGNVTWQGGFMPFGELLGSQTADAFQFTGLEQDAQNSSAHAWFRNLSTQQGRWLRPDPVQRQLRPDQPAELQPTSAEAGQATLVETYFGCSGGYSLR